MNFVSYEAKKRLKCGKFCVMALFAINWYKIGYFRVNYPIYNKKNGANDRIRTGDLFITSELLYQLSHIGTFIS